MCLTSSYKQLVCGTTRGQSILSLHTISNSLELQISWSLFLFAGLETAKNECLWTLNVIYLQIKGKLTDHIFALVINMFHGSSQCRPVCFCLLMFVLNCDNVSLCGVAGVFVWVERYARHGDSERVPVLLNAQACCLPVTQQGQASINSPSQLLLSY